MNSRSKSVFDSAKRENRAALIGYMTAGFPDKDSCGEIVKAMVDAGVDLIEIGIPYSDPVMDGPVIQRASETSIMSGFNIESVFKLISSISIPCYVMSYWNPIENYGQQKFVQNLQSAGGVGVITPDLTIEESDDWIEITNQHEIDRTYVVAPSSSDERLKEVTSKCSGFVYAASLMGVTGAREALSGEAMQLVNRVRSHTGAPVAVGLGVSTAQQAQEISKFADGVIVGSAFIKAALDSHGEGTIKLVSALTRDLAAGVRNRAG
jgi:tryptophan synthase alpha chain